MYHIFPFLSSCTTDIPPSSQVVPQIFPPSSQVDEASVRDVCSEYGILQSCIIDTATESALVQYAGQDEAIMAKTGLDKNPSIGGISVVIDFAAEADVRKFYELLDPKSLNSCDSARNAPGETPEWYDDPISAEPDNPPTIPGRGSLRTDNAPAPSKWGEDPGLTFTATPTETVDQPSPTGASLWSDNGFLPGLASPWHTNLTDSHAREVRPAPGSGPVLSTFLPNGLF